MILYITVHLTDEIVQGDICARPTLFTVHVHLELHSVLPLTLVNTITAGQCLNNWIPNRFGFSHLKTFQRPDLDVASRICHESHAVFLVQCSCYLGSHLSSADVLFVLPAGKCQCLVWRLFSATAFLWATCVAPNLDLPLTRPLAMVIFVTQTVEWWVPYNSCLLKTSQLFI